MNERDDTLTQEPGFFARLAAPASGAHAGVKRVLYSDRTVVVDFADLPGKNPLLAAASGRMLGAIFKGDTAAQTKLLGEYPEFKHVKVSNLRALPGIESYAGGAFRHSTEPMSLHDLCEKLGVPGHAFPKHQQAERNPAAQSGPVQGNFFRS